MAWFLSGNWFEFDCSFRVGDALDGYRDDLVSLSLSLESHRPIVDLSLLSFCLSQQLLKSRAGLTRWEGPQSKPLAVAQTISIVACLPHRTCNTVACPLLHSSLVSPELSLQSSFSKERHQKPCIPV